MERLHFHSDNHFTQAVTVLTDIVPCLHVCVCRSPPQLGSCGVSCFPLRLCCVSPAEPTSRLDLVLTAAIQERVALHHLKVLFA